MSDETVNLALPYILPSQAQKHVTHNESLQKLDAVVHLTVLSERNDPPSSPDEGSCYLIATNPSGAWSSKSGLLAFRQDGAWIYLTPRIGWRAFFISDERFRVFRSNDWSEIPLPPNGGFSLLGVNATPDATNRLSLSSPATLLNHQGSGHQLKINKASASDTASLLFQSNWSGRAEMGLTGSDEFSIKVSGDGGAWATGLAIAPGGIVKTPNSPVVRASLSSANMTPAANTRTGFSTLHLQQGNFALGAAVPSGVGNRLIAPVSGLYLCILSLSTVSSSGHSVSLQTNATTTIAIATAPSSTMASRQCALAIVALNAGDWLSLLHSGTAQFEFGLTKTELSVMLL